MRSRPARREASETLPPHSSRRRVTYSCSQASTMRWRRDAQRLRQIDRRRRGRRAPTTTAAARVADGERLRQRDRALERVAQLAHVARPGVAQQRVERLARRAGAADRPPRSREEARGEQRNVLAALAQRRHRQRRRPRGGSRDLRGSGRASTSSSRSRLVADDDAHVDGDRLGAADAAHLARLERAQELRLQLERQLADLVEEERAAVGALEGAGDAGDGAGEGAALVAEELALDQRRRHGAAVDDDERLAARARLARCSASATRSLPVPVSPCTSTVVSAPASAARRAVSARMAADWPTRPWKSSASCSGTARVPAGASCRRVSPTVTTSPGASSASRMRTRADEGAVLGAEIAHANGVGADGELAVQAGDARVGEHDVGERARADAGATLRCRSACRRRGRRAPAASARRSASEVARSMLTVRARSSKSLIRGSIR